MVDDFIGQSNFGIGNKPFLQRQVPRASPMNTAILISSSISVAQPPRNRNKICSFCSVSSRSDQRLVEFKQRKIVQTMTFDTPSAISSVSVVSVYPPQSVQRSKLLPPSKLDDSTSSR